jgi:hypothetical protein
LRHPALSVILPGYFTLDVTAVSATRLIKTDYSQYCWFL